MPLIRIAIGAAILGFLLVLVGIYDMAGWWGYPIAVGGLAVCYGIGTAVDRVI